LIGAAQDADKWAIRAYTAAIQLDPTNPRLRILLGGVYYANKDYLSAANLFAQSTNLKADYANAHYNLAQALKQLQRFDQAKIELENTQRLVAQGSADHDRVSSEIAEVTKQISVAGAQTSTQPTVSQLEGEETTAPTATQEPINNEGENPSTPTTQETPAQ
jgi:tetratricopeptide (TPR) repeat protein